MEAGAQPNEITLEVTYGAIANGYLTVAEYRWFFPDDAFERDGDPGIPLVFHLAGRTEPVETVIRANGYLLDRTWRGFYESQDLEPGDRLLIERVDEREYRITGVKVPDEERPVARDWARKSITRESVLKAIAEFDRDGRDEVLQRHRFRRALDYVVVHDDREYDSKALYGIAYGYEYPDERPIRERGLQGGKFVTMRLEKLGFEVRSLKAQAQARPEARAWIIRAGADGENEDVALAESVAVIGWSELGELDADVTREQLKERIRQTYGETREASLAAQASSIYRFIHDVHQGDIVVLPMQTHRRHVAVGIVEG
ncbi:MAG: hypothetical protein QOK07_3363, partial [Gemmatimonadaceae bacterium]|nr:hypothetical protein [Gemmatimonadaceae bacterium]